MIVLTTILEDGYKISEPKQFLQEKIKIFAKTVCMICLKDVEKCGNNHVKLYKDAKVSDFLKEKKFEHVVCDECHKLKLK
jgi:hypothetical protein